MAMRKYSWDYDALREMYVEQRMSIWAIGEKLGVDGRLVGYHLKRSGVVLRKSTDVKQERNAAAFEQLIPEITAAHQAGETVKSIQRRYSGVGKDKIAALCAALPERELPPNRRPEITPALRAKLSASAKRQWSAMTPQQRAEFRAASRASISGERNHNFGRVWSTQGRGKRTAGVGCDGQPITFRSSWEKLFADYLNKIGVVWQYEPETVRCGDLGTYTPDFFVKTWNCFVEVKGWLTEKAKAKIDWFRDNDPRPLVLATKSVLKRQYGVGVN